MNERIQELLVQSGLLINVSEYRVNELDPNIKKFAELIVKECAKYVKNTNCFTYASQADLCAERMKQHFGVK